jgi:hypothetical protein
MRHKWDNLVARFKGDLHTKTRGTPATNGGEEEEEGGTGVSVPRGRKPGKGKVTDPTPTPKVSRGFEMNFLFDDRRTVDIMVDVLCTSDTDLGVGTEMLESIGMLSLRTVHCDLTN